MIVTLPKVKANFFYLSMTPELFENANSIIKFQVLYSNIRLIAMEA
jgi:hypothetical protein